MTKEITIMETIKSFTTLKIDIPDGEEAFIEEQIKQATGSEDKDDFIYDMQQKYGDDKINITYGISITELDFM